MELFTESLPLEMCFSQASLHYHDWIGLYLDYIVDQNTFYLIVSFGYYKSYPINAGDFIVATPTKKFNFICDSPWAMYDVCKKMR